MAEYGVDFYGVGVYGATTVEPPSVFEIEDRAVTVMAVYDERTGVLLEVTDTVVTKLELDDAQGLHFDLEDAVA